MIAILNTLIFLVFLVFLVVTNIRMTLQVRKIKFIEANILFMFFLIGLNVFYISEVFQHYSLLTEIPLQKVLTSSLGLIGFSGLCLTIILRIKDLSKKKVRTLLRLPLIGALAGFYFELTYVLSFIGAMEVLSGVYLSTKKDEVLYVYRQQLKSIVGIIIFIFASFYNYKTVGLLGYLLFLVMKIQIINVVKLKISLKEEIS